MSEDGAASPREGALIPIRRSWRPAVVATRRYVRRMRSRSAPANRLNWVSIGWSGLGAFLGLLLIQAIGAWGLPVEGLFLIGSFGASAVLIYGAPLADLSQPRHLIGGHVVSAVVGVAVAFLARTSPAIAWMAPALAVSLAIMAMHGSRTLHPPGGATALIAVIGGEPIRRLGWWYVLCPVLIAALAMLVVALAVNNLSTRSDRHYPRYWW